MTTLSLESYWMGRDVSHAAELTQEIRANAVVTVGRINALLGHFVAATNNQKPRKWNSGWRPAAINAATPNAAKRSKHMTGQAGDVSDDESLDSWCMTNDGKAALILCKLWMEHPSNTPGWSHFQIVPPKSGSLIFYAVAPSVRRPA